MRLLLDTCAFIWIASNPGRVSQTARTLFSRPGAGVWLSAVSAWEIAIKHRLGRLRLPGGMLPWPYVQEACRRHRIDLLPLTAEASALLDKLPEIHRDPFDRMLVCQAVAEQMTILTPDPSIAQYPVMTQW